MTPPSPTGRPDLGPLQTPSIFNRKKKPETTEESTSKPSLEAKKEEEKLSEPFDQEQVDKVWKAYIDEHTEAATDMEQLIFHRELKVKDEKSVVLMLRSALETSILERFEHEMVISLRKALKNDFVILEKEVLEEEDQTRKLYTNADKFDYMAQQNPQLKELKDRLGLDFDY